MHPKLRIEIYIPTLYNPDKEGNRLPIETNKRRHVKNSIVKKYKGISMYPLTVEGVWVNQDTGQKFYDNCYKYEVCIDPTDNILKELEKWKEQ